MRLAQMKKDRRDRSQCALFEMVGSLLAYQSANVPTSSSLPVAKATLSHRWLKLRSKGGWGQVQQKPYVVLVN